MILLPMPIAYAEIHYRFRYFFSLLKKREPEIIADVPHRLQPDQPLPILLFVKDAHLFPITLLGIEVFLGQEKALKKELNVPVRQHFFEQIFEIPSSGFPEGIQKILVKIVYRIKNKVRTCFNDNYRRSSHEPFFCYLSKTPLPGKEGIYYGDVHSHSSYTEDQIEFGAELPVMQRMAKAIGLDFFAVTDHSYDLDDLPDNYLKNDPNLSKWNAFQKECRQLNQNADAPLIIPGEELSVGSNAGQNVHLLIWNNPEFIQGKGDSGEKWLHFKPDYTIPQIPSIVQKQAMLVPAHAAEKVSLPQKIFINRGEWHQPDLSHSFFKGLQFINGGNAREIKEGIQLWVGLLLKGFKLVPLAGNDAHGHFARTRQISIPFLSIKEMMEHRFGVWKTGVFFKQPPKTPADILAGIREGCVFVTDGPFLEMQALSGKQLFKMGEEAAAIEHVLLHASSSPEFGPIYHVKLILGDLELKQEQIVLEKKFDIKDQFNLSEKISLQIFIKNGYIRSEVITTTKNNNHLALTNAIWIRKVQ